MPHRISLRSRSSSVVVGICVLAALTTNLCPLPLSGQVVREGEVSAGSETEDYLRLLQDVGRVPAYPWSVRAFSLREVHRLIPSDSLHPWGARLPTHSGQSQRVEFLPIQVGTEWNSAFPYGFNDGAIWAGRGFTTYAEAGVQARFGPLSLVVNPIAFRAENRAFPLVPNGRAGAQAFGDSRRPVVIDLPQRFGDDAYTRFDWGQSSLRLEAGGISVGASTANEYWGPADVFPLVLGDNAAGFPHAFLGSANPWNVWIGHVHGKVYWGRLGQSDYATTSPDSAVRFMTGLAGAFTPRGIPGLEIGFGRFIHMPWTAAGISLGDVLKPFSTFAKIDLDRFGRTNADAIATNQLANVYLRWVFPRAGAEVYGEFAREDNAHNLRDVLLEPESNSGYLVGFRKVYTLSTTHYVAVRGETMNTSISHLVRGRRQEPFYVHGTTRQGHTELGQPLGSAAGYGGAGSEVALESFSTAGRWTLRWNRMMRGDQHSLLETGTITALDRDVMHALAVDHLIFLHGWDLHLGVAGVVDLNRDFSSDKFDLNLTTEVTFRP